MSLTKTISAIFTTIGIAIPSALTTWVLTKPKPLKEIDKTIELDEYDEEIEEKEIKPQEAPTAITFPPILQRIPEQIPNLTSIPDDLQTQEETSQELPESSSGGGDESERTPSVEEQEDPIQPPPPEPTEEKEPEPEESDPEKPDEKEEESEKEEEDVEEIKKSLVEAIGVIIQKYKDGYRIETGGIYDSFDMNKKLEYLIKSIEFLKQDKKEKEEAAKEGPKEMGSDGESSKGEILNKEKSPK